MRKISLFLLLLIVFILGFYLFYKEGTLPVDKKNNQPKIFVIKKGENITSIINNLEKEDLIRNKIVFYLVVKRLNIEKKIQAGDFRLYPSMDAYEIAKNLTHGTLDVWLTIIEGLRKEEIAQIVGQDFNIPETEFLKKAKEGYLFPDTYLIPKQATAGSIVNIMTNNFNRKYNQELQSKAKAKKLTDEEIIILASLVEKEAKFDYDRQKVASIILKRYRNEWPLQIDATIQYALGYQPNEKTWWKKNLTKEDLEIDSPYNSYKNKVLPPTPICNPGLTAIQAVIAADESTPYWYYLSDKNGQMHYAKTLEEHNDNIRKYLYASF